MNKVVDFVSLNNKNINFTQFPDQRAVEYRSRELAWDALCRMIEESGPYEKKEAAPWLKLAVFNGEKNPNGSSYRYNAGVVAVTGVECDYDAEDLGVEEAVKRLEEAEICCFIYTSGSHTADKPRFRVLAPFSAAYKDTEERMKEYRSVMIRRIESVLGVKFASESHTLSQAYYYGRIVGREFKTFNLAGEFITERWDLDQIDNVDSGESFGEFTKVNRSELVSDILTERAYHTSLRSLAAAGASDGYDYEYIKTYLDAVMDSVPSKGDKWQSRKESIPALIRSALRKFGAEESTDVAAHRFEGVPVTFENSLEFSPFSFVIDRIMPAAVMGIAGAGGSAKSTIVLWTMLHIVTGRPVFGCEILKSGSCVFVSAEDEKEMVVHRVQRMCAALKMTEQEIDMVSTRLFVEDVSGTVCRLVESKRDGNLDFSASVDGIVQTYRDKGAVFIAFDPATYFGAGERFVNDGEALMMSAGRRIAKELGACVAFVHHVGKQSGRDKTLDQYSGRGGSAFADNSRAMWSMAKYDYGDTGVGAIPEPIQDMIADECDVSRLVVTKMSYGAKPKETLWIGRDKQEAWEFHAHWSSVEDKARTSKEEKERGEEKTNEQMGLVVAEINRQLGEGAFPNLRSLRSAVIMYNDKKLSAHRIADLVKVAESRQIIYEADLPEHLIRGARKTYWQPYSLADENEPMAEPIEEKESENLV